MDDHKIHDPQRRMPIGIPYASWYGIVLKVHPKNHGLLHVNIPATMIRIGKRRCQSELSTSQWLWWASSPNRNPKGFIPWRNVGFIPNHQGIATSMEFPWFALQTDQVADQRCGKVSLPTHRVHLPGVPGFEPGEWLSPTSAVFLFRGGWPPLFFWLVVVECCSQF